MLTMNLLQALPKTPLWDRLKREGRLNHDPLLESNVRFRLPYNDVVAMWRRCVAHAYDPDRLFKRFEHQISATYANRFTPPARGRLSWTNLKFAAGFALRLIYYVGIRSDYRRQFWRGARLAIARGQVDIVFANGFMAHHLIEFSREALSGEQNASFYSTRDRRRSRAPVPQDLTAMEKSA